MDLIDFRWWRCVDGYRLRFDEANPSGLIEAVSEQLERYRPEAFPALFRHFADTPPTGRGMLHFADRFGLLGAIRLGPFLSIDLAGTLERQRVLRRAIKLFEAGDFSGLAEYYNQNVPGGRIQVELRAQPTGKIAPVFVPQSLIAFLWLQFALHAASEAKLFRCERCGTPFRVGTGTGRRDTAKFCSNACKVAAFRGRQRGSVVRTGGEPSRSLTKKADT
jgi:hypothetical protein